MLVVNFVEEGRRWALWEFGGDVGEGFGPEGMCEVDCAVEGEDCFYGFEDVEALIIGSVTTA